VKLYYYAHTGHKNGLDRLKKATALLKALNKQGIDTMLLVNDFRAGLAAREFGINESVTIETVQDIDAIASLEDVIIIDSPENHRGRLEKYCTEFRQVFRMAQSSDDRSEYGEILLSMVCEEEDEGCISSLIIDDLYFQKYDKIDRTVFFLGDSDANKTILSHREFFEGQNMELLLGHYFYVKYEDELAKIFSRLHESEEYSDIICHSKRVVTASLQCALEARVSGAEVLYILTEPLDNIVEEKLRMLQVNTVKGFDRNIYEHTVFSNTLDCHNITQSTDIIAYKIIKLL